MNDKNNFIYPCKDCKIREYYAKYFDMRFDYIDCFFECPFEKERENDNDR